MHEAPVPFGGFCLPPFEQVEAVFRRHLLGGNEIGAGVCAYLKGRPLLDLWGGWCDAGRTTPWHEDTVVCMQSTGKGVGMACLLMLVDRGLLDLDAPVARYWPEFGQAGKDRISVRLLMSQGAGLPFLDELAPGSIFDRAAVIRAIELQKPAWEPGTRHGYHVTTIGFLMDELMRRITGQSISQFLRDNVSTPLGADFFFDLSGREVERCADLIVDPGDAITGLPVDTDSPMERATRLIPRGDFYNTPQFRSLGIPNVGHGNARGLARIFASLLGDGDGFRRLVSETVLADATRDYWHGQDAVMGMPISGALVFMKTSETVPMTGGKRCFGIPGAGGSIGLADPDLDLAFAFCTNKAVPIGQELMMRELLETTVAALRNASPHCD